jgi:hypothetical protein
MLFAHRGFLALLISSSLSSCVNRDFNTDTQGLVSKGNNGSSNFLITTMITSPNLGPGDFTEDSFDNPLTPEDLKEINAPQYCWYSGKSLPAPKAKDFSETALSSAADKGIDAAIKKYAAHFDRVNTSPMSIADAELLFRGTGITKQDIANSVSQSKNVAVSDEKMQKILDGLSKSEVTLADPCPEVSGFQERIPDDQSADSIALTDGNENCRGNSVQGNGVNFCCAWARSDIAGDSWISKCRYKTEKTCRGRGKKRRCSKVKTMHVTGFWKSAGK